MKIGSLFDGSGGFPLAGYQNGFTPVWASEVEPYPIRVTKERFPGMKHLGSVTEINGAEIEPVDVITFGSPCQDLSTAGKQKGIHDGARSSLFFQAVRIIKEMRENDRAIGRANEHIRPRFAVWENVPGAYSSNGGRDFQAVLQALCEIADPAVSIPFPQKGKWANAGCIVGDGYSIAWRTYDAKYWPRTPQRRKRIYLIADFAGERAGEILFERESVPGHPEPGGKAGQGIAADAERSAGGSDRVKCLTPWDCQIKRIYLPDGVYPTLPAMDCGGANNQALIYEPLHQNTFNDKARPCVRDQTQASLFAAFMGGQGSKVRSIGYSEQVSPTLKSVLSGGNTVPDVVYPEKARTLAARHDSSPCIDRGQNVVSLDCRNMVGNDGISGTLQAKNEGGYSLNFVNPVVYDQQRIGQYGQTGTGSTLMARLHKSAADVVVDKDRRYIVRRLTPLECCRLQGFPDGWGDVSDIKELSDEEHAFWLSVRNTHEAIIGRKPGKYTKDQMIRWLNKLHTDSAEYKMWGNGIALPCASDVMRRIAKELRKGEWN